MKYIKLFEEIEDTSNRIKKLHRNSGDIEPKQIIETFLIWLKTFPFI